jgi:DTW domain-containing protein YfiP
MNTAEDCQSCEKPLKLCVCAAITPIQNRVSVLILRHPQEQDRKLGTARIANLQLENSTLKTGLSWANLNKALGRTKDQPQADPKRWGILYLGMAKDSAPLPPRPLTVINKNGNPAEEQDEILKNLEGIIALDGNWQQAKALWWRNAWMLKCRRLVLQPDAPSLYDGLRKEPRRESVSTIEAIAHTLAALEDEADYAEKILPPFKLLLAKARQ